LMDGMPVTDPYYAERQSVSVAAKRPEDFCDAYQGPFKEVLVVREELEVISHGFIDHLNIDFDGD
jgi:hypothetical protein